MFRELDWLQACAEVTLRNLSVRQKGVYHALHGGGGNGEYGYTRKGRRCDSDQLAGGIDNRAAGSRRVQRDIQADYFVQLSAAPRLRCAADAADHAQRRIGAIFIAADCQDQAAGAIPAAIEPWPERHG